MSPDPPIAVCVTGMHRSGTSFVAGALRFLGVSLGDPSRLLRPGPDNPAGYFEVQSVTQLDDELLAHLGGAWDQPPVLDPGWEHDAGLDGFRARAAQVLEDTFGLTTFGLTTFGLTTARPGFIGWKDPRLSLLLPFWRTVIPIATTIVLARDPREVVASLAVRRYRVDAPQAASLWLRYLFAAIANDPGHLLVRHSDVFEDLTGTVERIVRHLGLPEPDEQSLASVRAHLDPALRHFDAASAPADLDNPLLDLAELVWNGGDVDVASVGPLVGDLLGRGWLRPPIDGELLARARADVVAARETLRQRNRQVETLQARLAAIEGAAPAPADEV